MSVELAAALPDAGEWILHLYIAGQTPKSLAAISNLERLREAHLAGRCVIEVIDLLKNSELASRDAIIAIPTLVRKSPGPVRKIIGDLSDLDKALAGLQIRPAAR